MFIKSLIFHNEIVEYFIADLQLPITRKGKESCRTWLDTLTSRSGNWDEFPARARKFLQNFYPLTTVEKDKNVK